MASTQKPGVVTLALSTPLTYIITLALVAFTLVGAYAVRVLPTFVAYVGVETGVLALLAFLVQDLTSETVPTGWPTWSTFAVITVVGALEAGIGVATASTFVTLAAGTAWLLLVVQWAINYLNSDQGANIPLGTEMQIVALLGIVVTVLTSLAGGTGVNATYLTTGVTVTTFASLGGYFFAKEKVAAARRALRAASPAA
jgi:hypothetical protein